MERIPSKIISNLDAKTIKFQNEIINRLRLFDFSKEAILYYSESQNKDFKGYSFEKLQSRFKTVHFKKGSTIKSIEYKDIVSVGNAFISGELSDSIFVLNVATFEHWVMCMIKALILSNPRAFFPDSKKQIDVVRLKKYHDMHVLWEELCDEHLNTLLYEGMNNVLKKFLKYFGLKESNFTKNIFGKINEKSMCRNVIIHNQKTVNATYVKKCGKFGKFAEGTQIIITEDLLVEQAETFLRFMQDFRKTHAQGKKAA